MMNNFVKFIEQYKRFDKCINDLDNILNLRGNCYENNMVEPVGFMLDLYLDTILTEDEKGFEIVYNYLYDEEKEFESTEELYEYLKEHKFFKCEQ